MASTPQIRRRQPASWTISVAMIALAFFTASSVHANPLGIPAGSAQEKSIDPGEQESLGWLILRGELIPGPYQAEIVNHHVTLNGRSIDAPLGSAGSPAIDPAHTAREKLFQQFQIAWERSLKLEALSAAQRDALSFWKSSPLVASAEFSSASTAELLVLFCGQQVPDHVALIAPDSSLPPPDETRDENLRAWASSLQEALSRGRLVVVQGEGHSFIAPAGEGEELLRKLREIVATVSDSEERFKAVRKLVPDDGMARDIAERFR